MDRHSDERLFEPTLGAHRARTHSGPRPWRLDSQGYVSFFGGPLAAAIVGVLNGRRLGLPHRTLAAIAAAGLVAFVAAAALLVGTGGGDAPRLVLIAAGVGTYLVSRYLQKPADQRWRARGSDEDAYASLWAPGLAIVVGAGVASGLVLAALLS